MMLGHFTTLLSTLVAAQAVFATPLCSRTPYQVKEAHFVPRQWKRVDRAPADHVINLKIGIRQGNFAELERRLYQVSDPDSPLYGHHLSADEVAELVKPDDETSKLVHEWLADNGVAPTSYSRARDWVSVSLPVSKAEALLDTKYDVYEHAEGGLAVRATRWSLPMHLHARIDTIQPTTSFLRPRGQRAMHIDGDVFIQDEEDMGFSASANDEISQVCNFSSVTPQCFETLYQTKGYKTQSAGKNKIGFTNFLEEHPIRTDLAAFLAKFRPESSAAQDLQQLSIAGGPGDMPLTPANLEDTRCKEANLDVQAIAGLVSDTPIVSYSVGGSPPSIPLHGDPGNEPYLEWVQFVQNQTDKPQVISTSYSDDERTVPLAYARRVCDEFAQLGARGTTLLFVSGDVGVAGVGNNCDGYGKNETRFVPLFPSGCPFVTTVGATMKFRPEVVAYRPFNDGTGNSYASGGGFSDYFATPDYQKDVVASYIDGLGNQFEGLYNKSGRGYPDMAAQGLHLVYFWNGTEGRISGTSASTPLAAAVLSLVNDALIAKGKSALGFLNPWLYKKGFQGLTDVTIGSAIGCATDGFPAVKGWDAVTGFGTPIFSKLIELALN